MLKGIDISKWQTSTPSLTGLSFIVIRASVGGSQDTMWATHYANARKAGLIVMAYHYGLPSSSVPIATQVAKFVAVAKDADYLWLDQEEAGFEDAQATAFIAGVRATGRPCGLYHSSSGFGGVSCDAQWVADWRDTSEAAGYPKTADGSKEFSGWDLWQYDGGGADGIDNDYWNPATPVAVLLRQGYIAKSVADAAAAEALSQIAALKAEIVEMANQLEATEEALGAAEEALDVAEDKVLKLTTALAAAPATERARIAEAEAARIRAL